ncbi:hypothetical protein [Solidesulfovibrio sp.]
MRFPFLFVLAGLVICLAAPALAGDTKYINAKGQYLGKQDAAGRFIDAKGKVRGREDGKGRLYDEKGRLSGNVERNDKTTGSTDQLRGQK